MIRKFIFPPVVLIPLILLQVYVAPIIEISGIVPDLIIIFVVFYTIGEGQLFGMVVAFASGFIIDMSTGNLLGASMLSGVVSAFLVGFFYNENKTETNLLNPFFPLFVLLGGFINSALFNLLANFNINLSFPSIVLYSAFLPALYTAFIGAVAALVFHSTGVNKKHG